MPRMRLIPLLMVVATWAWPTGAVAQGSYPDKPIKLIVPQAPGSATDTVARILANALGPELGQTVVIENKPGAAFTIGLDLVAKAAPDGYTLGIGPIGALAISPNMIAKIPYNIERDFQPIALIARGHLLLAVAPKSEFHSVKDIIDEAKSNPGKLTNASSATGSPGHVGGELFKAMTGTEIVHVRIAAVWRDQRSDRGPRATDVRKPELDRAARQVRRGARPRGQRPAPLAGIPGAADGRRRACRATTRHLERRRRAGRYAEADGRRINAAVNRAISVAGVHRALRLDRRRAGRRHAGGVCRDDPDRSREMGDVIKRSGAKLE